MILKNTTFIDPETFEFKENTNIKIEKGTSGKYTFVNNNIQNDDTIDCSGLFVTKSFVVGHHHAYSALAAGMPQPKRPPVNFLEILKNIWWHLDKKLDAQTIEASALVTAMNCALKGSTFVIDHHASPFAIENSLEIIAKAFEKVGVSHLLCYEISDRDGEEIAQKGIDETENYLKNHQGLVGLHASFTIGEKTMQKAANLMQKYNSGVHIHVAEDPIDQFLTYEKFGTTVIERLQRFGLIDSTKTILSHCLHLSDKERQILSKSKAFIVQNTESNLNNDVGLFESKMLNEEKFMLGTDGMHSDMIKAMQATYFTSKINDNLSLIEIYAQLRNNHNYLKYNGFKGDDENNLIVFSYNPPTLFNQNNFLSHFFFSLTSESIIHVISNGELIVKNKKLQKIDEQSIISFAREQTKKLWSLL